MMTKAEFSKVTTTMEKAYKDTVSKVLDAQEKQFADVVAKGDVTATTNAIFDLVDTIDVIATALVDGDATIPAHLTKVIVDSDAQGFTISVRSRKATGFSYRRDMNVTVNDNTVANVVKNLYSIVMELFTIRVASENVEELNKVLAQVVADNSIPYSISFVIDITAKGIVSSISDTSVVFVASLSDALEIKTMSIMQGGDSYSDLVRDMAMEKLVDGLKVSQTPVQLIKNKVELICDVTGLITKKRVSKQLRDTYHRNAKYIKKVKSACQGYFQEKIDVDGDEVEVFAIVEKDAEGKISVVLSPFNTATCMTVDYDVVAAVEAM